MDLVEATANIEESYQKKKKILQTNLFYELRCEIL